MSAALLSSASRQRFSALWRSLERAVDDAVFVDPTLCPHCASETASVEHFGLCPSCGARLDLMGARRLLEDDVVRAQGGDVRLPHVVYTAAFYNNFLRTIFGQYKMAKATYYAPIFQRIIARYAAQHPVLPTLDWVSYIPQTHRKTVLRGSHPARELAGAVAEATGHPLVSSLSRCYGGAAQKTLSVGERAVNVRGRFFLEAQDARRLRDIGGVGIVVDDFLTTGSTMAQAMVTLEASGIYAVGLCLAAVHAPREDEREGKSQRRHTRTEKG